MERFRRLWRLAWSGGAVLFTGCSLSTVPYVACEQHSDCREAFGFGWECGDEGLCQELQPHVRCGDTYPSDLFERPERYEETLVFGTLFDHQTDESSIKSAELALDLVEELPLAIGSEFSMIHCSYETDLAIDTLEYPEAVEEISVWLADNVGVAGVVGPATSSTTATAYSSLAEYRTLIVSPSATSSSLTYLDGLEKTDEEPGQLWRTAAPDDLQATVIANDMHERGQTRVAVIYQEGPYGTGLAEAFSASFPGTVESFIAFSSETDRNEAVVEVGQLGVGTIQEVFFVSSEVSDIIAFVNSAAQLSGYLGVRIFLADGAADQDFLDGTTASVSLYPMIRGTRPAQPEGPVWDLFVTSYISRYGESPNTDAYTAYAHDAAWLLLYGAAWSYYQEDEVTGLGMARGLRRLSTADAQQINLSSLEWPTGRAQFQAGNALDIVGTSGNLDYDPETEEAFSPIDVWVLSDESAVWAFKAVETITE